MNCERNLTLRYAISEKCTSDMTQKLKGGAVSSIPKKIPKSKFVIASKMPLVNNRCKYILSETRT